MKKTYCDGCEKEFSSHDHQEIYIVDGEKKVAIALTAWANKGYIGGDICNSCVSDIIKNGNFLNGDEFQTERRSW